MTRDQYILSAIRLVACERLVARTLAHSLRIGVVGLLRDPFRFAIEQAAYSAIRHVRRVWADITTPLAEAKQFAAPRVDLRTDNPEAVVRSALNSPGVKQLALARKTATELRTAMLSGPLTAGDVRSASADLLSRDPDVGRAATTIVHAVHNATIADRFVGTDNKLVWTAILDSTTCVLCSGLDGKSWNAAAAPFNPPAHSNCRCVWVPLEPGQTARRETYDQWFARQGEDIQREILGPARYAKFVAGVPLASMAKDGRILPVSRIHLTTSRVTPGTGTIHRRATTPREIATLTRGGVVTTPDIPSVRTSNGLIVTVPPRFAKQIALYLETMTGQRPVRSVVTKITSRAGAVTERPAVQLTVSDLPAGILRSVADKLAARLPAEATAWVRGTKPTVSGWTRATIRFYSTPGGYAMQTTTRGGPRDITGYRLQVRFR